MSPLEEGLAVLRAAQTGVPARSRGSIALLEENCTVCMVCARECPDWCIEIDSHTETVPARTDRGRPRQRHVLDRFAIDFGLCMWCGICIEACPFDALFWSPELVPAGGVPADLVAERDVLRALLAGVPVPPPLDPAAAPTAEQLAARP